MPEQNNNTTDTSNGGRGCRRQQAAARTPGTDPRTRAEGPARRELRRILLRNRDRFGRIIVQMFTRGMQRIVIRLGDGRTLSFARVSSGTQMDIVDVGDGTMVLTVVALAELRNREDVLIARTGLEVTTREVMEDGEDDSDYNGEDKDSGEDSDSSTSDSSVEQEEELSGDSDAESDSDQETYREEIYWRVLELDLSYEGTLALLAALANGEDNYEEVRRQPRVCWADEETSRPLHSLPPAFVEEDNESPTSTPSPEETRNALNAVDENYARVVEDSDSDEPESRNVILEDGVFETLVDIVERFRRDPDELDRNGISEAAAAPFRRAGMDWRELVEHMRAQDAEND